MVAKAPCVQEFFTSKQKVASLSEWGFASELSKCTATHLCKISFTKPNIPVVSAQMSHITKVESTLNFKYLDKHHSTFLAATYLMHEI